MYNPEEWQLVLIHGTDPHYRIFGSWRGGFATGDSWRMNSGIVSAKEVDGMYEFTGHTGSIYRVHPSTYGVRSSYNRAVLNEYVNGSSGTIEILEEMPDVLNTKWVLPKILSYVIHTRELLLLMSITWALLS